MREPGVGRSGGLTDWYLMNVADMWACLQDHQADHHWRHVAGWRKICDLAGQHLTRLRTYRDGLARAWPPETNTAARVYLAELDDLIDQVQSTHDAAAANQSALSAATQALTSTRTELKKIYDEYATKLQQKRAWDETAADPKAAAGSRATQPPVTDTELERLNIQARGIMYGLSGELQQAQVMLRQPPPAPRTKPGSDQPSETVAATATPIIPPIIPIPLQTVASPIKNRGSDPVHRVPTPKAPALGPILGGTTPGPTSNPAPSTAPSPTPIASPNSPNQGALPPGISPVRPGSGGAQKGTPDRPFSSKPPAPPIGSPSRPLPPNGIIGGIPTVGSSHPPSDTQPRRVNPVGGVIGGGSAGTAPTGSAGSRPGNGRGVGSIHGIPVGGSPLQGHFNQGGLGGTHKPLGQHHLEPERTRRWDPDNPWETEQGVKPIVQAPDDDEPIDPGPAIGLNR